MRVCVLCRRKTVVMPVGGGIVANTYGLAAGLLFRGIRLVQCPTSFLNAHDAAASSQKQAINHTGYKNIVGLYHVPTMALIDTSFYETLGVTELKAGLGELTKNAALFGGQHYELIKKTTMTKGVALSGDDLVEATYIGLGAKDMLLAIDPKEKHLALLFEYGHTVGHALELTQGVRTSHGEGVTIGMLAASYISNKMGIMGDADREAHDALVLALDPQIEIPKRDITEEVLDKVMHDNKRGYLPEREGFCPFILNQRIGEMHAPNKFYLEYVPVPLVREAIIYVVDRMRRAMAAGGLAKAAESESAMSRASTQEKELDLVIGKTAAHVNAFRPAQPIHLAASNLAKAA
uniref:3-dehydroquinate synthase domain-containing protein n=1 Tax=Chrysotila carterae TaxID=13221 RepID=A0A7S4F5L7_CHRCT